MMNSEEIFEEYTKATAKRRYIAEKAAELGVKESDIICELFKSGYKFEEIRRANKGIYNAGMKKYEKWLKNGSPENEEADAPESHCPENDTTEQENEEKPEYEYPATDEGEPEQNTVTGEDLLQIQDRTIAELKYKNDKLEVKLKALASENVELKAENSKLEKDIEILNGKAECLETQLNKEKNAGEELGKMYQLLFDDKEKLMKEKKQFMERIDELEAEKQVLSEQYAELNDNYNEAMMINRKIEQDAKVDAADLESERENLVKAWHENDELKKRLHCAEHYILNSIYEGLRDHEDGEV